MKAHQLIQAAPEELHPNPWNSNLVSPQNAAKLDESLRRHGFVKPVLARETDAGLQILGGSHRVDAAKRLGLKTIPVYNLGQVDDKRAREIGLIDNSRYGSDDTLQLAQILEDLGESANTLASFLPYYDSDLEAILAVGSVDLDALLTTEEEEKEAKSAKPETRSIKTHQIMRFKVPVEDADAVSKTLSKIMKTQGFSSMDSLTNAGDALVWLVNAQMTKEGE